MLGPAPRDGSTLRRRRWSSPERQGNEPRDRRVEDVAAMVAIEIVEVGYLLTQAINTDNLSQMATQTRRARLERGFP